MNLTPVRNKALFTLAGAALAGGFALSANAQTTDQPQGIYSADDILDAEVYLSESPDEQIGEVEDIVFNEAMQVTALVVESGSVLGLGGREIIVEAGQFSLLTETENDDDVEHRVMLDATAEELEGYPVYSDDWWADARLRAQETWQQTQEGAQSAWQTTQEGAERAWETTQENAQRAWESARDAVSGND
ncbi:PRC-barrel domain-containing protein [Billgrantia gudaonensis]|uniref:PRC-barrel domain-containing protein n=1 Tax=Billgrantia gudaonensis TaxID=376427 RepID=A0A1G8RES2_9GAMM|nr:PRC-barrel domain-containing protein [Halomonas gudaonensis]SDJ15492.1 PRC-barrel domain-containing protein [Halomonas gudaonensis]